MLTHIAQHQRTTTQCKSRHAAPTPTQLLGQLPPVPSALDHCHCTPNHSELQQQPMSLSFYSNKQNFSPALAREGASLPSRKNCRTKQRAANLTAKRTSRHCHCTPHAGRNTHALHAGDASHKQRAPPPQLHTVGTPAAVSRPVIAYDITCYDMLISCSQASSWRSTSMSQNSRRCCSDSRGRGASRRGSQ